jgi:hypothetical protein
MFRLEWEGRTKNAMVAMPTPAARMEAIVSFVQMCLYQVGFSEFKYAAEIGAQVAI